MPRHPILNRPEHKTISIEAALRASAVARAKSQGFTFSEYVARLLVADISRKNGIAGRSPRTLPAGKA